MHKPIRRAAPDVLIAGHVTRDVFGDRMLLGGAAAFAARAASCLGLRACVVTSAPAKFSLLGPLRADPRLDLVRVHSPAETTFHLTYGPQGRSLAVSSRARDLTLADVPAYAHAAPLSFVAPVVGECDRAFVEGLSGKVVAGIQGWLRTLGPRGQVLPALSPLVERPPATLNAAVFSELDHPESEALARHLANCDVIVALTRGGEGVSLFLPDRIDVPAASAVEVDPTGAGDVFGLVFGMALAHGHEPVAAAQWAAAAAARVVEGPGLGNLATAVHANAACAQRPRVRWGSASSRLAAVSPVAQGAGHP